MKFRSTIIYLLAAMVLVALYLYETRKEAKEKSEREEAKLLFTFKPSQLESLFFMRGKESILLERRSSDGQGAWEIVAPIRASVDSYSLSALTNRLTELKFERLISNNISDLTEFGLDKPSLSIAYKVEGEEGNVSFGAKSPIGHGFYATLKDQKKVYLVAGPHKQELDKTLYDLRDKKLITLETDKINRVIIEGKSGKWQLYKKDDRWFLEGDEELKIDREKVEVFVRPMVWAEAMSFETEEANDLKPFGLESPAARVALSDGIKTEEIILGDFPEDQKENSVYAKVVGKPQIVTVRKRLLEALPTQKDQISEKEPEPSKTEGSSQ